MSQRCKIDFIALLIFCLIYAITGSADARISEEEQQRLKVLNAFKDRVEKNSAIVDTLQKRIDELEGVDIRRVILGDVPLKIRLLYAQEYLEIHNDLEAIKNFYLALTNEKAKEPGTLFEIDSSLAVLWEREDSQLSLRNYILRQLKNPLCELNPDILNSYIINRFFDSDDYALLKSVVSRKGLKTDDQLYMFSKIALKYGDLDTALAKLDEIGSPGLLQSKKLYALGAVQTRLSQYEKALEYFKKSLHISENLGERAKDIHDAATAAIARINISEGQYNNAASLYSGIKQSSPFFTDSLYETSYIYYKLGDITRAEEYIDYLLLASPTVKVHLDSLKFKGRDLKFGGYDPSNPTKSYSDLVSRIDFEKMKLKSTLASYRGNEEGILDVLNADYVQTRTKSIPTTLIIKSLREDPRIEILLLLKKELTELDRQLSDDSQLISTLQNMMRRSEMLFSFQQTFNWLEARSREIFEGASSIHENLSIIVTDATGGSDRNFKAIRDQARKGSIKKLSRTCKELKEQISPESTLQNSIANDVRDLISKSKDLNKLTLTGWSLMDGERERLAINVKDELSREFKNLKSLKQENSINLSIIRSFENSLERQCKMLSTARLDENTATIINDISRIKRENDRLLRSIYTGDKYIPIKKAYQNAYELSLMSKKITDFLVKLKLEESNTLAKFRDNLQRARQINSTLGADLIVVRRSFAEMSRPVIAGALARIEQSLNRYAIDYGWGLINSHFEAKRKTNLELKKNYLLKESELNRIEGNFKVLLNDQ